MIIKNPNALEKAALQWWVMRRPLDFTEQAHLDNPTINTTTADEKALASAVAQALRVRGAGRLENSKRSSISKNRRCIKRAV